MRPLLDFLRRRRGAWSIAAAAALLLAGVDAFGSGPAPPLTLYFYWLGMMLVTALVTSGLLEALEKRPRLRAKPLALRAVLVLLLAAAMTPIVWIVAARVLGGSTRAEKMVTIFPQALLIGMAFVGLHWALERRPSPIPSPEPMRRAMRPALLDRLPERLRAADIQAIEAEDHYLRVHTDAGSALILMRLSDAMTELEGIEGRQTHRSWWVAKSSIADAARGGGRAVLTLKSGLRAPVSRTYARALRRDGWF